MKYKRSEEYTVNLYRGCTHGCNYCYAPSLIHDERSWGAYVDARVNASQILESEIRRAEKRVVFVSSASDPYQPVEAKYKITRRVLQVLEKHDFPVLVLTRSPLVLRDLDILKRFSWARVGFSISSVPTKFYEPGVPSLERRLDALGKIHDAGIPTWVSLAPVIPKLIIPDLEWLFDEFKRVNVTTVTIGLLRFIGYNESKKMFEERSGHLAGEVMSGGEEVYQRIMEIAESRGIDTSGSCLSWNERSNGHGGSTLDSFTSPGA